MLIIRHCEDIIKTQNKNLIGYIIKQGQLLKKLKDRNTFSMILVKVDQQFYFVLQVFEEYSLLKKST